MDEIVKVDFLNSWLVKLGGRENVLGVYEQGSRVWGFADEESDRDFIVIWKQNYPEKDRRREMVLELGGKVHDFKDISVVSKGVDMFESKEDLLNVAHTSKKDFFDFYDGLNDLGKHYEEQLLRIGGFVHGKIHYDPRGKLEEYREDIVLTDEIVSQVRDRIEKEMGYDLRILKTAMNRDSALRFIHQADNVLNLLHIWYYMRKGSWLMSEKWFESFAKKHDWNDEFVKLLRDIKEGLSLKEFGNRLLNLSNSWGFKISKDLRA